MNKIAILADSGCQININDEHSGIYIAPLCITMNGKTYLDQIEINSVDVFEEMNKNDTMVQTSQPSTGELVKVVEQIKADGYDEIIGIPIATGLSSTLNGMKVAADMIELPITLIDSKGTAREQRELVETAARLVAEGKTSEEVKTLLEEIIPDSGTIIMVPNLKHLAKGGRTTPSVAKIASMLKIVPVMELNYDIGGRIDSLAKVRTTKKAMKLLVDRAIEKGANAKDYVFAIEHVLCETDALQVKEYLEEKLGACNVILRELPAVVGAHMGVGGIGLQYMKILK